MKIALITIAIAFYGLFFGEWFLRLLNPQALMPRYIQAADYGIRENIPNAHYRHSTPEIEVFMQTNSLGMRDHREYTIKKPEGVCRVAIFGDSFFMGYEVSWEDSYAGRLEKDLKDGGKPCQVLNFAVSGFGTAESLITLKEKALAFEPDYVILEWHHTDPVDSLRSNLFKLEENGVLSPTGKEYLPGVATRERLMNYSIYLWATEYSHLYAIVRQNLASAIKDLLVTIRGFHTKNIEKPAEETNEIQKNNSVKKPDISTALVNSFCKIAQENEATCIIADMPSQKFNGDIATSLRLLDLDKIHVDKVVTPVKIFEQQWAMGQDLFRYEGHNHFNELGYRIAASVASDYILRLK